MIEFSVISPISEVVEASSTNSVTRETTPVSLSYPCHILVISCAPSLEWSKVTKHDLAGYVEVIDSHMLSCHLPPLQCKVTHCTNESCRASMQKEYDYLISSVKEADATLPRQASSGHEKDWWSEHLSDLKKQSIEIQRVWISHGRPKNGPIHHERLRVRAMYRKAMKKAQKEPIQRSWNQIYSAMEVCDSNKFWRSWKILNNKNGNSQSPIVEGCTSKSAIADLFSKAFERNCKPNNETKVKELDSKFTASYRDFCTEHNSSCNCHEFNISIENVIDAISGMKLGKCADEDGLTAEHFQNAPLSLLHRLTTLLDTMLKHSFVPSQYRFGIMITEFWTLKVLRFG